MLGQDGQNYQVAYEIGIDIVDGEALASYTGFTHDRASVVALIGLGKRKPTVSEGAMSLLG